MKLYIKPIYLVLCIITCTITSCTSDKTLVFADYEWHVDKESATLVNTDSTYRFCFGDCINPDMSVFNNSDSIVKYPGLDKYLYRVLSKCRLGAGKILFFSPTENVLFVELPENHIDCEPQAITSSMSDEHPYTAWVWKNDVPEGQRHNTEIYTNSYLDKKLKLILIVDKFHYADNPIARITFLQSQTKKADKLGITPRYWQRPCDVTDLYNIIPVSNWIDGIRNITIKNYVLGQQTKKVNANKKLQKELAEIIRSDQEPRNRIVAAWNEHPTDTLLHRSIAAEVLRADSINLIKVCNVLDSRGFVSKDEVGDECIALWLVIQHSPLEYQQKYLPIFKIAAMNGDLPKETIALMEDRVALQLGKPQIYGSQGNVNEQGIFVPAEMIEPENVDSRRAKMDMIPLAEYIKKMSHK